MNNTEKRKQDRPYPGAFDWICEVLIFVTVVPGALYGILSLGKLPIA